MNARDRDRRDPSRYRPEIDWLKGLAILFVFLIHSKPLEGTFVYDNVINRAVPVFVVLFGATSDLWWRKHRGGKRTATLRRWYASRFSRLMIPLWAVLVLWWPLALVRGSMTPSWAFAVATFLGYVPWVATGWFITLILELVVLFPFLRRAVDLIGLFPSMLVTGALVVVAHETMFTWIDWMQWALPETAAVGAFYYFWIFPPAWLFAVVCGMALARREVRVGRRDVILCGVIVAVAITVIQREAVSLLELNAVRTLADPALACLLLAAVPIVGIWRPAGRFLAWCGVSSWGLYLAQLLVINVFVSFGEFPDMSTTPVRWAFFACLLVGAVSLVLLGTSLRTSAERRLAARHSARIPA